MSLIEMADLGTRFAPLRSCPPGGTLVGGACHFPETEDLRSRNVVLATRMTELTKQIQSACRKDGETWLWLPTRAEVPPGITGFASLLAASQGGDALPEVRDPRCVRRDGVAVWGGPLRPTQDVQDLEAEYFRVSDELKSNWSRIRQIEAERFAQHAKQALEQQASKKELVDCGPKPQTLLDRSHSWTCCPNRKTWVIHHWQSKDPCGLKPSDCGPGSQRNLLTGECLRSDAQCGPEPSSVGVMESPQHRAWRACRAQGPVTPVRGTEKVSAATIVTGAVVAASLGLALWISLKD